MRRGKHLLALQAVKRAIALAGQAHPDVHRMIVRVCKAVSKPATENGATQVCTGSRCKIDRNQLGSEVSLSLSFVFASAGQGGVPRGCAGSHCQPNSADFEGV